MEREDNKVNKLKGQEDWNVWKFQLRVLLTAHEAYKVTTGEQVKPDEQEGQIVAEFQRKLKEWTKADSVAQKLIVLNVSEQPMLHILNCQTAAEMWRKLVKIYEGKNETNKHLLQQNWFILNKDSSDDLATHISKMQDLAYLFKITGESISDSMIITKILMTLHSTMSHFVSAWESTSERERTITNLTSRLIAEETRQNNLDPNNNNALMAGKGKKNFVKRKKPGKCHNCGKPGHWKRECRIKKNNDKEDKTSETQKTKGEAGWSRRKSSFRSRIARRRMDYALWCYGTYDVSIRLASGL